MWLLPDDVIPGLLPGCRHWCGVLSLMWDAVTDVG